MLSLANIIKKYNEGKPNEVAKACDKTYIIKDGIIEIE